MSTGGSSVNSETFEFVNEHETVDVQSTPLDTAVNIDILAQGDTTQQPVLGTGSMQFVTDDQEGPKDIPEGSLDTESHRRFASKQKNTMTSRFLDKGGFSWLLEVEEDSDEPQKPLL